MKICSACKRELPLADFAKSKGKRDGHTTVCKSCTNAYNKSHYQRRKPDYLKKARAWEARQTELIRQAKEKPCADCGGAFPVFVMDFDHLPGAKKAFGLGNAKDKGTTAILAEIAKCEVVCANCHRLRTWSRMNTA
jgi:hypothetical protein